MVLQGEGEMKFLQHLSEMADITRTDGALPN